MATFESALNGNAGMNAFMKFYKPWLYHNGAVITLADGSSAARAMRVQQACHVMQAFNLFGLREHIPAILSQPMVVAAFGKRLKMGLNGADKVLSIFQILQCPSNPVDGLLCHANCAHDSRTEKGLGPSCDMCCAATLRKTSS